jgi:hypothetical protein
MHDDPPPEALRQSLADRDRECALLRERLAQLTADNQSLRSEVAALNRERDVAWQFLIRGLCPLPRGRIPFMTPEEMEDLIENGQGIDDIVKELEQLEGD